MLKRLLSYSFHKKLVVHFSIILLLATVIIGFTSFYVAQNALNLKGRQILENSVHQALDIIELQYEESEKGFKTEQEAKEDAKEILLGPFNADGTRNVDNVVDLGNNGYFLIYDSRGTEVMHPALEGSYVWDVAEPTNSQRYIVQEQIQLAKENADGGFMTYDWYLLNSDEIGAKYSFGMYFERWDWIIVATAYAVDFNSDANQILLTTFLSILALLGIIILMFNRYINSITKPISSLLSGMQALEEGTYQILDVDSTDDELGYLVNGYNQMIDYLKERDQKIRTQNREIAYLAYHDEMTQLPNFYWMKNYLDSRINEKVKSAAFVLINIRGLKTINALMGYDKGNDLLKEVGRFLQTYNQKYCCARTGSNEFCLWMEIDNQEDIKVSIEYLKDGLNQFIHNEGFAVTATFRITVSMYPEHGNTFEALYEKATLVMKLIKDSATTYSEVYQNKMKTEMEEKIQLFEELSVAMEQHEIIPYYQRKVDYMTGKVVGVEALARWHSKKRGMISPGIFLPLIVEMNLTDDFTDYMIERTLEEYDGLCKKYGEDIDLSINVTPSSFLNTNLFDRISQALNKFLVPSGKLILEITEDVFVSDIETIQKITKKLHQIGVRTAIDDFGTGYSSLNSLVQIEFDELKIDKSFIDKILTDEKDFELVKVFCEIAKLYGYEIVVEGVESEEQLEKLKETDLRIIQGYLFSKPEPLMAIMSDK
ncbi:EAL domain-containing protein [Eubacteriaceae bacterium ES3]|nr:EAL domain-containing protein [Eubacteriaceae bacterium ES3]